MKTTYTLIVLALSIQVMVNGQTPDNQARKIRINISNKATVPVVNPQSLFSKKSSNVTVIKNIKTEELISINTNLKDEMKAMQQQYIITQIELSNLKAQNIYRLFDQNSITIQNLINVGSKTPDVIAHSQQLNSEAGTNVKNAKEMREEANAQLTLEARLAELSNAEEKEKTAINKQMEAISILSETNFIPTLKPIVLEKEILTSILTENKIIKNNHQEMNNLLAQASSLIATIEQIKEIAKIKSGNEQKVMLEELQNLNIDYINTQIEITLQKSNHNRTNFAINKILLSKLMNDAPQNLADKALIYIADADYNIRLAKEMQEEAFAQYTPLAKLGELTNADEKEILSLQKQQTAFTILEKNRTDMAYIK